MLKYNLTRLFKLKGISNRAPFLMSCGFNKGIAYRLTEGRMKALTPQIIEKLCLAFECTPSDLMEWTQDDKTTISEKHPLRKLAPVPEVDLRNITSGIAIDKIGEFAQKIDEIKKTLV